MKNKEGLSDFIKFAYENGDVKDVSEAFIEYPVEEEWHKGRTECLLNEPKEIYSVYSIGDIVFVKNYQYENGKIGTNHLFVIIDQNNVAVPIENFGMLISSNLDKLKYEANKLLTKDEINGLDKDSIVKTDEIYIIKSEQILFKIGKVDESKVEEYKQMYYNKK